MAKVVTEDMEPTRTVRDASATAQDDHHREIAHSRSSLVLDRGGATHTHFGRYTTRDLRPLDLFRHRNLILLTFLT
jgi:hypothetical protein